MSSPSSESLERVVPTAPIRRVAYALAIISGLLTPVHFYVSCAASSFLCLLAAVMVLVSAGLCLRAPVSSSGRLRPALFALAAFVLHATLVH